jgi:hypothetical protein
MRLVVIGMALSAIGCGGDDPEKNEDEGPTCPTTDTTTIQLRDVAPAQGTSVPNSDIMHTFTTVGVGGIFETLALGPLPSHTAGALPPGAGYTALQSGTDVIYTFTAIAWPTAPGHVAIFEGGLYEDPTNGCVIQLPNPLFEYDIVVPP